MHLLRSGQLITDDKEPCGNCTCMHDPTDSSCPVVMLYRANPGIMARIVIKVGACGQYKAIKTVLQDTDGA